MSDKDSESRELEGIEKNTVAAVVTEASVGDNSSDQLLSSKVEQLSGGKVLSRRELWAWYIYGAA
ncbi:hypothetical protein FBU59_000950, partial [Linderina macrospora]